MGTPPIAKQISVIVADQTNSIKLVLWENAIDETVVGKTSQLENFTANYGSPMTRNISTLMNLQKSQKSKTSAMSILPHQMFRST